MKVFLFSLIALFSISIHAQKTNEAPVFSTKDGAIKGYDPVAYFTLSQPTKGMKAITNIWNGATWHFASEENKKMFVSNPEKFVPQYGGYCAYGWAQGYAVKIEPKAWAIEGGKLYLNYSEGVQKDWNKDRTGYIKKADVNYAKK